MHCYLCWIALPHIASLTLANRLASSAKYFPFSKHDFIDFKRHEWSRYFDAQKSTGYMAMPLLPISMLGKPFCKELTDELSA
nr:hypothetical protein [Tanacetum cinerariifolium]